MTKALVQASRVLTEIVEMRAPVRALAGSERGKPMVEISGLSQELRRARCSQRLQSRRGDGRGRGNSRAVRLR